MKYNASAGYRHENSKNNSSPFFARLLVKIGYKIIIPNMGGDAPPNNVQIYRVSSISYVLRKIWHAETIYSWISSFGISGSKKPDTIKFCHPDVTGPAFSLLRLGVYSLLAPYTYAA